VGPELARCGLIRCLVVAFLLMLPQLPRQKDKTTAL
jgi:hypothetical protein